MTDKDLMKELRSKVLATRRDDLDIADALDDVDAELELARGSLAVANKLVHEMVDVLGLDDLDVQFVKQALTPPNSGDARGTLAKALERKGWTRRR